jgi:hypothetical protein
MGLYYQTEYCIGRRGRTIRRTYAGAWAFLAIFLDLFFVMTFELVFTLLFLTLKLVFRVLTAVAYLLTLPFQAARWISARIEARLGRHQEPPRGSMAALKPAWHGFSEV